MKNRAVFLDRDGVIIDNKHHLTKLSDVKFIRGSAQAIKLLNKNFRVIVVSNQSVVARKKSTKAKVKKINDHIKRKLAEEGACIDAFYYCPHHPDFSGKCLCRKPAIGMLLKAKEKFGLDLYKSFFIGDKTHDIKAGKNACCTTILVKTGYGGSDEEYAVRPDYTEKNLLAAAKRVDSLTG